MSVNLKKVLSVILCAVLLSTTASVAFAAEEGITVDDSEMTDTVREENLFEKLENKVDSFLDEYAAFFFFGFYFIIGLPALPIALPIVILQMLGVDLPFMKV